MGPRASVLLACAALVAMAALPAQAQPATGVAPPATPVAAGPEEFRVTLLGTGSPAPVMRRFGPAVLVEAGGKKLLIDSVRAEFSENLIRHASGTDLLIHQVAAARKTYDGPVLIGEDLMAFRLERDAVVPLTAR